MEAFIGSTFDGVISQVSTFGVTVRLENTALGNLPVEELGDEYFSYDPARHLLSGVSTGRVYRLGQRLRVVLVAAYPRGRRLSFKLAPEEHHDSRLSYATDRWV